MSGRVAGATETINVKTNYYTVTGQTKQELKRSLAQSRPWRSRSDRDARTEWKLHYDYRWMNTTQGCRITQVSVTTTVTLTLPAWRARSEPEPDLVREWQRYFAALMRHEKGHEKLGQEAGQELQRRLDSLGEINCADLEHTIRRVTDELVAEFRKREAQYDKETEHGAREGARW